MTWLLARSHPAPDAAIENVEAAVAPPSSITRFTELPVPSSEVAEAKAEYVAGIQAIHDASVVPGIRHLLHATSLDPSMAAAYLRLSTYGRDVRTEVNATSTFTKARELHALLTPRDQALLAALEPSFLAIPPDETETTHRLRDLAARWPLDAELQYLVAAREREPGQQGALLERVLQLDPGFALALWRKANIYLSASDFTATVATLDRCLEVASSSTACLTVRTLVHEELGRCDAMERDARLLELVSPSPRSYDLVARVLFANGAPVAAVREALERKWAAATGDEREEYRADDEIHLAILGGDFVTAERLQLAVAARAERSAEEDEHRNAILPLVALYLEMGQTGQAARVADQYLRARAGWQSVGAWSPVPQMFAAATRGGLRTQKEREAALAEWLRQWDTHDAQQRGQSWVLGYATPAATEADAQVALAAAAQPLPRAHTNQFHREGFGDPGKVLLLAGHVTEALPLLRAAAATCSALPAPLDHTQANLNLGLALEATGDTAAACAAYKVVLDRWGASRPRSVSGERARGRYRTLRCD